MIPNEHKEQIIQSGIGFMRSITDAYGTDEGMKLWDTIASALDPDIKGQIFFAMLTGEYNNIITVASRSVHSNKISVIKAIRAVTGLGLKEAKDLSDELDSGKSIRLMCDPKHRHSSIKLLREAGVNV